MARSENQKLKLLYLTEMFAEQTDEDHPFKMQDIVDYLARRDVKVERKTVYDDIECLREHGLDIVLRRGADGGYFLGARDVELSELKLLVDAVLSSKFLTTKKSLELIGKLEKLTSRHNAGSLHHNLVVSGRVKSMEESIYYNVDALHEAIAHNSQVTFRYFEWSVSGKQVLREGEYTASPYAMIWDDENYYLVAHSERHGLTHYRVDKMLHIRETGEPRYRDNETDALDVSAYGKTVFSMFGGESRSVKMRFTNDLAGVVIDRFGRDVMLIPDGDEHFTFTTKVTVAKPFFGWISQFGDRAVIQFPPDVAKQYKKHLQQTLAQYKSV